MKSIGRTLLGAVSRTTPVPFTPRAMPGILGGVTRRTDATMQLQTMGAVGTLFAIVNATSEAQAMTEWKLWRKAPSGKAEDRTEVTSHLALTVWNKPNSFYTRQELVESLAQHVDLTGEGWLLVQRDSRATFPTGLWVVRPDKMEPVPDPEQFIAGYIYNGPNGERVPLGIGDVVMIRMPNPMDPYRGMGPVQSVLTDIDSTRYSAEWNRNFFRNSAEPGGIIHVPEMLGDTEFAKLKQRWNEQHQGVTASHRVSILEGGMQWVDRRYTMRDMQFTELRGVNREIIREAFRFPKPVLGTVEDVNRANAEAAEVMFARWLVKPRLERIKQVLNNDFLPLFGTAAEGLEFDYTNPVPDDQELAATLLTARANAAKMLVDSGYDHAGVLDAVGLPQIAAAATQPASGQEVTTSG